MHIKQRQIPLEVSSWMDKDVKMRKVTANSRLITNDTRQNIVLSRRFFTDLFTLSMQRYRKINECDHNQDLFLRQQMKKAEHSLPGLRPYVESEIIRKRSSKSSSSVLRREPSDLHSASISSFPAPLESKSDPSFDRRMRRAETANRSEILRSPPRTRLERLALAKGTRINPAGTAHIRRKDDGGRNLSLIHPNENDENSETTPSVDDRRFRNLLGSFAEVHSTKSSTLTEKSVQMIIQSNSSFQPAPSQRRKFPARTFSEENEERQHRRQMFIEQLQKNLDIFLIEVAG